MRKTGMAVLLMAALAGCAHSRPGAGEDAQADGARTAALGCSGIPSDPTVPADVVRAGAATHGPGAPGVPVQLRLRRVPEDVEQLPPLYVFDANAGMVREWDGRDPATSDIPLEWRQEPEFKAADEAGYWGEVVDDRFYRVPWLGPCDLAQMLPAPAQLAAPPGGLLFLQFVTPRCPECARLSQAIERTIARHPQLPVRWVQVQTAAPGDGR